MTKQGNWNILPGKSEILLENREIFRMKSEISVSGSTTPRFHTRLTPLHPWQIYIINC